MELRSGQGSLNCEIHRTNSRINSFLPFVRLRLSFSPSWLKLYAFDDDNSGSSSSDTRNWCWEKELFSSVIFSPHNDEHEKLQKLNSKLSHHCRRFPLIFLQQHRKRWEKSRKLFRRQEGGVKWWKLGNFWLCRRAAAMGWIVQNWIWAHWNKKEQHG